MNLIGLETSTRMLSVALWRDGVLAERSRELVNGGSELILPWVRELLSEAKLDISDLDAIAFGSGPGGFTGLRLACSIAQGMAFGAGLPVIGIGCLEALAFASGESRVYACIDARMNEVYCAAYEIKGTELIEHMPPTVASPELVPLPTGAGWAGCGDGFPAYAEALARRLGSTVVVRQTCFFPTAAAVARLAAVRLARGEGVDASQATPLYVRDKVALTTAERMARGGLR